MNDYVDVVQGQGGGGSSWEMILVQGFLVTLLVLISVAWACCCKKYVNTHALIKKKIKFSSYIENTQKGSVAKSYMWLTASSYMVKYLRSSSYAVYYEALPHIRLCNSSHLNFIIYEFSFLSVHAVKYLLHIFNGLRIFNPDCNAFYEKHCTILCNLIYMQLNNNEKRLILDFLFLPILCVKSSNSERIDLWFEE